MYNGIIKIHCQEMNILNKRQKNLKNIKYELKNISKVIIYYDYFFLSSNIF